MRSSTGSLLLAAERGRQAARDLFGDEMAAFLDRLAEAPRTGLLAVRVLVIGLTRCTTSDRQGRFQAGRNSAAASFETIVAKLCMPVRDGTAVFLAEVSTDTIGAHRIQRGQRFPGSLTNVPRASRNHRDFSRPMFGRSVDRFEEFD